MQIRKDTPTELTKAYDISLVRALGLGECSSREVSRLVANTTDLDTRRIELQARYVVRLLQNWPNQKSIFALTLNDMLNDPESWLRRILKTNELLKEKIGNRRIGFELKSLWSESEIAHSIFGGGGVPAWTLGRGRTSPPEQIPSFSKKELLEFRKLILQTRMQNYQRGKQTLLKEFPKKFYQVQWTKWIPKKYGRTAERLLIQWMAGGLPRRRNGEICRYCEECVESPGAREHVVRCSTITYEGNTDITWLDERTQTRHVDNLTRKIGDMAETGLDTEEGKRLYEIIIKNLRKIATSCLGRTAAINIT